MFVCFEGIDGSGKSTQARMLLERLQADGAKVELVADPGTTAVGAAVRQILLQADAPITSMAQMLLFSAARAELAAHIKNRIADGYTIICDRWLLSTLVYQGAINGIDIDLILAIFRGTSDITPDVCFLLDLDPEVAGQRIGKPRDRYERKSNEDKHRMRNAYTRFARAGAVSRTLHVLRGDVSAKTTHEQVLAALQITCSPC